jgi:hypothetical protein
VDEPLRPVPLWLAEHWTAYDAVVLLQDGLAAWTTDETLPHAVDVWLDRAARRVREHGSLGDEVVVTPRRPLRVLVDVGERADVVNVSADVVDTLAYHLRVDLAMALPEDDAARAAYVIAWAAGLGEPEAAEPPVEPPRLPRWRPPLLVNAAPREELREWARRHNRGRSAG